MWWSPTLMARAAPPVLTHIINPVYRPSAARQRTHEGKWRDEAGDVDPLRGWLVGHSLKKRAPLVVDGKSPLHQLTPDKGYLTERQLSTFMGETSSNLGRIG